MYFVKYGDEYLHDPRIEGRTLLDLSLDCEENSCGFCDFTIYPTNPMYDKLMERDADHPITVYDDDILLFTGFIYELGKAFYLDGQVKCKGELDYLNESVVRPYSTINKGYGAHVPNSVNGYFAWLIDQHNGQVLANKRFVIGKNQGAFLDNNNYVLRENTKYPTTISEITEKLLEKVGGYLVVRNQNGVRYIDYLSEWNSTNSQILDFGVNLTDYTQTDDSVDLATFVVPLGAAMRETEYPYNNGYFQTSDMSPMPDKKYYTFSDGRYSECNDLTAFEAGVTYYEYNADNDESELQLTVDGEIDGRYSVPDYKQIGDRVYNLQAVRKYGWIGFTYSNSDITTRNELLKAGAAALSDRISPKRTIEIKAVDMHLVNKNIKPIRIGEYVRVRSKPHQLDSFFLCTKIDLDLNNPENSLYTLGTTFDTLTGQQNKKINSLNSTIVKQYEESSSIKKEAETEIAKVSQIATEANTTAKSAVVELQEQYAISNSTSDPPQSGWSTSIPQREDGEFIWRRSVSTYGNGTTTNNTPVLLTGDRGNNGEDAISMSITSSNGTVFKNSSGSTVLTAHVYKGGIEQTINSNGVCGSLGTVRWYKAGTVSAIATSNTLTVNASEVTNVAAYTCQLEA